MVTGLIVGKYAFETYVNYRQYLVYKRTKPPVSIRKEVDQTTFDKSQVYLRAKAKFSFFAGAIDLAQELATIHFNLLPKLWSVATTYSYKLGAWKYIGGFFGASVIGQSLVFFALTTAVTTLLSVPLDYYRTFVLEEKFGFNKTTHKTFFTDLAKLLVLQLTLTTPFLYAFLRIVDYYGKSFVAYGCGLFLFLQLFFMTIGPILILPLFYKLTPLEEGELKTEIEKLAKRNEFPLAKLTVMDGSTRSSHSNAFFTGLPWSKQIVLFDTLISHNSTEETVAVLGHEIGHWKMNHLPKRIAFDQFSWALKFATFSAFLDNKSMFASFGFNVVHPTIIAFILFGYIYSPLNSVETFYLKYSSRSDEFQADKYALDQGYGDELASALIKLSIENLSSFDADWLYSAYNHSHPILAERLSAIGYVSKEKVARVPNKEE